MHYRHDYFLNRQACDHTGAVLSLVGRERCLQLRERSRQGIPQMNDITLTCHFLFGFVHKNNLILDFFFSNSDIWGGTLIIFIL